MFLVRINTSVSPVSVSHKNRCVSPEVEAVTKVLAEYIAVGTDDSLQFITFRPR